VSGNLEQITNLVDIQLTAAGLSDIVQVRFARTDANLNSDIFVTYVDAHCELDALGSSAEYEK
jgi:hypothetical protein